MFDVLTADRLDGASHLDTPQARTRLRTQAAFFFSHLSPRLLLVNAGACVALRGIIGGFGAVDVLVFAAIAVWWPLQEWAFHRWLLHRRPTRAFGIVVDPNFARAHRAHHQRPWIVETTLLPPGLILFLIPVQPLVWAALLPSLPLALTAASAYALWALLYEWTHYLTHTHYVPRGAYYRRIWKNHRLHHFKNEHHWYSFTVPYVDAWFGTEPAPDAVGRSDTVRTLGGDDG